MSYADFGTWAFFAYLAGCFTAMVLSLRASPDNRILSQTFGLWIAAAFAAHHFLVPHAAGSWGYLWYVWNMTVAAFPILPAYMLKDADARKPVLWCAVISTSVCGVYALFSAMRQPLPGILFFYEQHVTEACQVISMVIWSGPVVPLSVKAWKSLSHWRMWPWMHRAQV